MTRQDYIPCIGRHPFCGVVRSKHSISKGLLLSLSPPQTKIQSLTINTAWLHLPCCIGCNTWTSSRFVRFMILTELSPSLPPDIIRRPRCKTAVLPKSPVPTNRTPTLPMPGIVMVLCAVLFV